MGLALLFGFELVFSSLPLSPVHTQAVLGDGGAPLAPVTIQAPGTQDMIGHS